MENFMKFFEKIRVQIDNNVKEVASILTKIATLTQVISRVESRLDEVDKFFEFLKKFFPP